jgi:ArsR family transcriptional regulator
MKNTVKTFKALSDPTRLRIVMLLLERDLCVCELQFILEMEQSRISHQLRILRDADMVEDKRDGKWIVYTIPKDIEKRLALVLGSFLGKDLFDSQRIKQDKDHMKICVEKQIRKSHGIPPRDRT